MYNQGLAHSNNMKNCIRITDTASINKNERKTEIAFAVKKETFPLFSHCLDWVFRKILVNRLCFFCEEEKPQACQSPGLSYKLWFKNISKTEKYGKLRMESDFKLCNELERNVGLLKTNFTFNLPVLEKLLNIWAFRMYSPTIWCGFSRCWKK